MSFTWSSRQEEIFDFDMNNEKHLIVESRAGTAKTTTLVEMLRRKVESPRFDQSRALVCAFNNRIKDELATRVSDLLENSFRPRQYPTIKIDVGGVHQIGFGLVRGAFRGIKLDENKGWRCASKAVEQAGFKTFKGNADKHWVIRVAKLAQLAKYTLAETEESIKSLAENFELYDEAYPAETLMQLAVISLTYAINDTTTCDFDDQIWFPARFGLAPRVPYPYVYGDEVQDWNAAELWIIRRMLAQNGRLVLFGDPKQAVYAFKGADSNAMPRMYTELLKTPRGCETKKLTTTYRCPKAVVREANRIVPDFEADASAPEGSVKTIDISQIAKWAKPGDVVISRLNGALAKACVRIGRGGVPSFIVGQDYGDTLLSIINRSNAQSTEDLITWATEQMKKDVAKLFEEEDEDKAEKIVDKYTTIIDLAKDARSIEGLKSLITSLFQEKSPIRAVPCSTVHKAKGLEWNRVFLLKNTFSTKTEENRNILYVALTRAKKELFYVVENPSQSDAVKIAKPILSPAIDVVNTPQIKLPRLGGPAPSKDGTFVPYYDIDD